MYGATHVGARIACPEGRKDIKLPEPERALPFEMLESLKKAALPERVTDLTGEPPLVVPHKFQLALAGWGG